MLIRRVMSFLFVLALTASAAVAAEQTVAAQPSAPEPQDELARATTGFYPLWENSGYIEPNRHVFLSTMGAQFGVGNVAHVGVYPIHFMYRTPNAYAKFKLAEHGDWSFAGQVGVWHLMEEASRAFVSPMFTSRLDNPDYSVDLIPIAFSASWHATEGVILHQSLTALPLVTAGPLNDEVTLGYSLMAEFQANRRHAVLLHGMEIGFTQREFTVVGASYRYRNHWMEFRLGYFYRFRPGSSQSSPLIGLGFPI